MPTAQRDARRKRRERHDGAEHGDHAERRERRALSSVGGTVETRGPAEALFPGLLRALSVESGEHAVRDHVHGFHSYAARLHPGTARHLVLSLTRPGETVLDPFCGSGTVLVEARLQKRRAIGLDANPLAVELAALKSRGVEPRERARILEAVGHVVGRADERRRKKAPPSERYGPEELRAFDIHMLLELDGLRNGIEQDVVDPEVRRTLFLLLSSIVTKVSKKPGDTAERTAARRLKSGFAIHIFEQKAKELVRQLQEFAALLPEGAPPSTVLLGDARHLAGVPPSSVDAVITSPPYPGVYDYASQHAMRLRWLRLDPGPFTKKEIGSRRKLTALPAAEALSSWERELAACFEAMKRALRPEGRAALVLADSALSGRPVRADEVIARVARKSGLAVLATASQARPNFHSGSREAFAKAPRKEHVLVLGR